MNLIQYFARGSIQTRIYLLGGVVLSFLICLTLFAIWQINLLMAHMQSGLNGEQVTGQDDQVLKSFLELESAYLDSTVGLMMGKSAQKAILNLKVKRAQLERSLKGAGAEVTAAMPSYWQQFAEGEKLIAAGDSYGANEFYSKKLSVANDGVKEVIKMRVEKNSALMTKMMEQSKDLFHKASHARAIIWSMAILIFLLTAGILWMVVFMLQRSLLRAVDELGNGAHQMIDVASGIGQSSQVLLTTGNEELRSLQETRNAIGNIRTIVEENLQLTMRSQAVAKSSIQAVGSGLQAVSNVIHALDEIGNSTQEMSSEMRRSNEQIQQIVGLIEEIKLKTNVINDIVFQTRLLAFNASVEAARAGEHGKGFAVVAEEVGNLASHSGNAATEIASMLEASVERVHSIMGTMKERIEQLVQSGQQKMDQGLQQVQACNLSFEAIQENVNEMAQTISTIAKASEKETHGVQEIGRTMDELAVLAQSRGDLANQNNTYSQMVATRSQSFVQIVSDLEQLVGKAS